MNYAYGDRGAEIGKPDKTPRVTIIWTIVAISISKAIFTKFTTTTFINCTEDHETCSRSRHVARSKNLGGAQ